MKLEKPNYTQVPNILLESIASINESALKVMLVICRSTLGYHEKSALLTMSTLVEQTGLCKQSVIDGVKELLAIGWIVRERKGESFEYGINIEEIGRENSTGPKSRPVEPVEPVQNLDRTGLESRPQPVQNLDRPIIRKESTKKLSKKERFAPDGFDPIPESQTKREPEPKAKSGANVLLPAELDSDASREAWSAFVRHRRAFRNVPFTEEAAKQIVKNLLTFTEGAMDRPHDAILLLNTAIERGWRTVFPPKDQERRKNLPNYAAGF